MDWILRTLILGYIVTLSSNVEGQRVAPGVPPQHYQQQVPQQQMHQQQVHQQQQQYQQPPPQQQQQQQQQHQQQQQFQQPPPQQHQPHNHGHTDPQQILNAANIAHEKEHIAEHLDVPMDTSKMTEQELQFHYFKMHDADNNNKLDGCELIKSLIHWHGKIFQDKELIDLIDPILNMDDTNKDGYIDYPEFVQAQQKSAPSRENHK
ncbi:Similar to MCFD2: Multiple coagulation factor deficiency protein 2 homolog (Pongo abelii) [Cotesia congregata]|uniref:Similar to MCFD2: Multiple coagulation factor deficiency protein 2 homolog (Pongo abelii) n=1 Tax=Cotesia congregata TaxID=51543 RepID=A0A8J2MDH9_COTCN|nr:Similar to MCFD2: Multiple coagulation factor deficiency protein 2 homolog (Pongo abelii) [Cotesia congregata]